MSKNLTNKLMMELINSIQWEESFDSWHYPFDEVVTDEAPDGIALNIEREDDIFILSALPLENRDNFFFLNTSRTALKTIFIKFNGKELVQVKTDKKVA